MDESHVSLSTVLRRLLSLVWTFEGHIRSRVLFSLLLTAIMMGLKLIVPFLLKIVITALSQPSLSTIYLIHFILCLYAASWIIDYVVTNMRTLLIFKVLERALRLLTLNLVEHLLNLSLRFHIERKTGALTSYLNRLQYGFESVFWGFFSFLLPTIVEMVSIISIISYMYGWRYSIALFIIMAGYAIFNMIGVRKSIKAQEIYNEKRAHASARIVDSLLNYETIKYFNNEVYELNQVNIALKQQELAGVHRSTTEVYVQLIQACVVGLGFIYLTWISGLAVYKGEIGIGDFVMINGYVMQFILPLNHFGYIFFQIKKGLYDIQSTFSILNLKPEVQEFSNPKNLNNQKLEIAFDQVDFKYTSDRDILKNVSFLLSKGKKLAIVGPTGSGKSTIGRLIFRFYDVTSGMIRINNCDIRHFSQKSLHQMVGVVPQDIVLFNDTLYYNIAYGNPTASKQDVEAAIRLAQLESFIDLLPKGYHTIVGERGLKLSAGERQRISIARVLLKKPALFIFDEATSSLDTLTERQIQKNINEISKDTTTIIIAHRLSTIVDADEILVLDQGKIIEQGSHSELFKKNGLYSTLWNEQKCRQENIVS